MKFGKDGESVEDQFEREKLIIGEEGLNKLREAKVAVFGVGGVGSYCVEALARAGVGKIDIFDGDVVDITNINRQLIAVHSNVGKNKTDAAKERILDINPAAEICANFVFYGKENEAQYDFHGYSYIADAIDCVSSKLLIIENAKKCGVPVISCMGTGNKINPQLFEVDDIYNTSVCPLARVMRRELRKRNIDCLKVVYSKEEPIASANGGQSGEDGRRVPGSISFVPPVAGMLLAGEIIKDILNI